MPGRRRADAVLSFPPISTQAKAIGQEENLYDAVLLGTRRIGHALALIRHPRLLREVKTRDIAIEVCPISNQLLGFVADLHLPPEPTADGNEP